MKSGPHQCNVCKNTVDSSRSVSNKNLAFLLGLSESDIGSETRVCNPCFMKAQRKKGNSHCPIPVCTTTKGRIKGRLRHMPNKLKDMPKDAREAINNEFRKLHTATIQKNFPILISSHRVSLFVFTITI